MLSNGTPSLSPSLLDFKLPLSVACLPARHARAHSLPYHSILSSAPSSPNPTLCQRSPLLSSCAHDVSSLLARCELQGLRLLWRAYEGGRIGPRPAGQAQATATPRSGSLDSIFLPFNHSLHFALHPARPRPLPSLLKRRIQKTIGASPGRLCVGANQPQSLPSPTRICRLIFAVWLHWSSTEAPPGRSMAAVPRVDGDEIRERVPGLQAV